MDKGAIGVMFRYEDNQNYYRFVWTPRIKLAGSKRFKMVSLQR